MKITVTRIIVFCCFVLFCFVFFFFFFFFVVVVFLFCFLFFGGLFCFFVCLFFSLPHQTSFNYISAGLMRSTSHGDVSMMAILLVLSCRGSYAALKTTRINKFYLNYFKHMINASVCKPQIRFITYSDKLKMYTFNQNPTRCRLVSNCVDNRISRYSDLLDIKLVSNFLRNAMQKKK